MLDEANHTKEKSTHRTSVCL